jgi:hypothetical protein
LLGIFNVSILSTSLLVSSQWIRSPVTPGFSNKLIVENYHGKVF